MTLKTEEITMKILTLALAIGASYILIGCGSSSSNNSTPSCTGATILNPGSNSCVQQCGPNMGIINGQCQSIGSATGSNCQTCYLNGGMIGYQTPQGCQLPQSASACNGYGGGGYGGG